MPSLVSNGVLRICTTSTFYMSLALMSLMILFCGSSFSLLCCALFCVCVYVCFCLLVCLFVFFYQYFLFLFCFVLFCFVFLFVFVLCLVLPILQDSLEFIGQPLSFYFYFLQYHYNAIMYDNYQQLRCNLYSCLNIQW